MADLSRCEESSRFRHLTGPTSPRLSKKRRSVLLQRFLHFHVRFEFRYLNAVNGRAFVAHLPNLLVAHFFDPQDAVSLQPRVRRIHRTFVQRPVEIAAPESTLRKE